MTRTRPRGEVKARGAASSLSSPLMLVKVGRALVLVDSVVVVLVERAAEEAGSVIDHNLFLFFIHQLHGSEEKKQE